MQNFTAAVELITNAGHDVVGAKVTVAGHNLSSELITMLAKHAMAVEMGIGTDELERDVADWDIEEGTEESVCEIVLLAAHADF